MRIVSLLLCTVALATLGTGTPLSARIDTFWPTADEEKYLSVGWRLNLNEARREAQAKGKPLFLWMMNGHPTGCT